MLVYIIEITKFKLPKVKGKARNLNRSINIEKGIWKFNKSMSLKMPKDHMKVTTKYRWSLKKRKKKKITLLFELLYVMIKTENSWDN